LAGNQRGACRSIGRPAGCIVRVAASQQFGSNRRKPLQAVQMVADLSAEGPGLGTIGLDPPQDNNSITLPAWRCHMMKVFAVVALAAILIGTPAFAQSYDPDLGSGNISPPAYGR
jgi:hypothetical protein